MYKNFYYSKIITIILAITFIQAEFVYQIEIYRDTKSKQYIFTVIDMQTEQKEINMSTTAMNVIPIDEQDTINISQVEVIVQIQHYETGEIDFMYIGETKNCNRKNDNCAFYLKQNQKSNLPNLDKNFEVFKHQKAKSYAFVSPSSNAIFVMLILYDGYNDREIFLTHDFSLYYIDIQNQFLTFKQKKIDIIECDQLAKYIGLYNPVEVSDDDSNNYEELEKIRIKNLAKHQKKCEDQKVEQLQIPANFIDFFWVISFNRLNEPLSRQQHSKKEIPDPRYKRDENLNPILYNNNYPLITRLQPIFFISPIVPSFVYKLNYYKYKSFKMIIISEMIENKKPQETQLAQRMFHYIIEIDIGFNSETQKQRVHIGVFDLDKSKPKVSQVFDAQNIDQAKLIKILFDIRNESHEIIFDNSEKNIQKMQQFVIQSHYEFPRNIKLSFSHFMHRKIKTFGDVTKVDIYQMNFHCFFLPDQYQPQQYLYEGSLNYLDCNSVLGQDHMDYTDIQKKECDRIEQNQYKKILFLDINQIQCSTVLKQFDNILYEMYFINREHTQDKYKSIIKDVIKVDRRYSSFNDFYFIHEVQPSKKNKKCTINVVENQILVNFVENLNNYSLTIQHGQDDLTQHKKDDLIQHKKDDLKQHKKDDLKQHKKDDLIFKLNAFQCNVKFNTIFSSLNDSIQNQKIMLKIRNVQLGKNFLKLYHQIVDSHNVILPFIISNPKIAVSNADAYYQKYTNLSVQKNFYDQLNHRQNLMFCFNSLDKENVLLYINNTFQQEEIESSYQNFIMIDVLIQRKLLILRYQQKRLQIQIEKHLDMIKKQNFKKLNFHIYYQSEDQRQKNLQNFIFSLELIERVSQNFMVFKFDDTIIEGIETLFTYQELFFFEALQDNYNTVKQSQIQEFSDFDSESQSLSQMEEINDEIFVLKLTTNNAISNQALLHYQMQLDSSKLLFKKNVLLNQTRLQESTLSSKTFHSLYDKMMDYETENNNNMYCASSLVDIELTCPVNTTTFEFVQLNKNEDQLVSNDPFFDDKIGFVFSLFAPQGQLFVMDFIYRAPSNSVIQNCVALIFTDVDVYVSSTTSNLDIKLLSQYGPDKLKTVKNLIYRKLDQERIQQIQQNGSFYEQAKRGVNINLKIQVYNTGDRGEKGMIAGFQKAFHKATNKNQQLKTQYDGQDEQSFFQVQKFFKLTQNEIDRIETLQQERIDSGSKEEIVIKVLPVVFNLVSNNTDVQQRKNNILKYKNEGTQIFSQNLGAYYSYALNLKMTIDSFDKKYLQQDWQSETQLTQNQNKAQVIRDKNLEDIKKHLQKMGKTMTREVEDKIQELFRQQREYEQHYFDEFAQ